MLDQLSEIVTPTSLMANVLLGLIIGAFYGYTLKPEGPPMYPVALVLVGWAFLATFTAWAYFTGADFQPIYQFGRGILWTVTCSCIPIGRYARHRIGR